MASNNPWWRLLPSLWHRQHGVCYYCGEFAVPVRWVPEIAGASLSAKGRVVHFWGRTYGVATVEHLVPRRAGGRHSLKNCVMACLRCNNVRGRPSPHSKPRFRVSQTVTPIPVRGRGGRVAPKTLRVVHHELPGGRTAVRLDDDADPAFWAEFDLPPHPLLVDFRELLWPAAEPARPWAPGTLDAIANIMIAAGLGPPGAPPPATAGNRLPGGPAAG